MILTERFDEVASRKDDHLPILSLECDWVAAVMALQAIMAVPPGL